MTSSTSSIAPFDRRLRRRSRLLLSVAALSAVAMFATGCGDDGGAPSGDSGSDDGPVAVEHRYGTTEVPDAPERVVTVGLSDHEILLALGIAPVGVDDWFGERPIAEWPWTEGLWGDVEPEIIGERDELNFEAIAALEPDLIIGLYSGITEQQYETLSQIAPTVAQPVGHDPYGAPWQEMTRLAGRSVGRAAEAEALIEGIDRQFAAAREAHPDFEGQTIAVADPYEPGQYAVFSAIDPKGLFMTELGFVIPEAITEEAGAEAALVISSERVDLIDLDKLVFVTGDPGAEERLAADSVYANLDVVKAGNVVFAPYEDPPVGAAFSFNTVLSIPYALEQVVPLLAA